VRFPDAPEVPYTLCEGLPQTVWFDRKANSLDDPEDVAGVERSVAQIDEEIDQICADGIPVNRICVCGMSMGGALALHVAYGSGRHAGRLGAAGCLSGFLPADSGLDAIAAARFSSKAERQGDETDAMQAPPLFFDLI